MKVNAIRFDLGIQAAELKKLESEVERLLSVHPADTFNVRIARLPSDFLDASNFLNRLKSASGKGASPLPAVEKHVLLPGFRKILVDQDRSVIGTASLLPTGVLPVPVETFSALPSIDVRDLPEIENWIEIANADTTTEAGALLLTLAVYEVVMIRDGLPGAAFLFSEEPRCLIALLNKLGLGRFVQRAGGPVWVLIPPRPGQIEAAFEPLRDRTEGLFKDSRLIMHLSFEALESVIRFRPMILETLPEGKRKQIASLYPKDKAFQFLFSQQFLETLKHSERFIVEFPAKITWSNGFGVSGAALDISESGIRFRVESGVVPQDAAQEILISLQVDAIQSIQLEALIKRVSPDGKVCGLEVDANSVQFRYLVDWIRRSPFAQKTKS